jgi:ABC-type amino acid transport substrate-binding protein
MIGGPLTITPQRALRGIFAEIPVFYEDSLLWLRPGLEAKSVDDLANSKISVLAGSSQQTTGEQILTKATFIPLDSMANVVSNTATGRSDACLISAGQLLGQIADRPDMKVLPGPPLWVDINSYMIPLGDFATHAWISNWLRYESAHNTFSRLWQKWFVTDTAKKFAVKTTAVGPLGQPVQF